MKRSLRLILKICSKKKMHRVNVENVVDQAEMVEQAVVLAADIPHVEGDVEKAVDAVNSSIVQAPEVKSVAVKEANLFASSNLQVKEDPTQRENLF